MKTIQELNSEVDKLEQQLASDIAMVSAQLEPLPGNRDTATLEISWAKASITRQKLAGCLRNSMPQIKASKATAEIDTRRLRAARKDLRDRQSMVQLWRRFEAIVLPQLLPERQRLGEADIAPLPGVEVMDHVMALFMDSMHKVANPTADKQGADAENHGCHRDIPYALSWFSKTIGAAHRICLALQKQRPLRFLDVGSGGGTKVLAATMCFDVCDGLEYDTDAVSTGRRFLDLLAPERCKLIHGDALEFSDYGDYDVIYFFKPLKGHHRMIELEERIIAQARPTTVLLPVGEFFMDDLQSRGIHKLADKIYINGVSENEAFKIRNTAEQMGPMIPGFGRKTLPNPGYWTPLLEVSAKNGYFL